MNKYRFVFVVLHYNEPQVTMDCIKTILAKTKGERVEIVVIDNASPDSSGTWLAEKYRNVEGIHVILAEKNLGFAQGNNIGYYYAKEQLHADYICIMNNDVMLLQENFLQRIIQEYESSGAAVIGPHITLKNGCTNYMYMKLASQSDYERDLEYVKVMYRYYHSWLYPIRNLVNRTIDMVSGKNKKNGVDKDYDQRQSILSLERHSNIVLHGCCLIFTPVYIERFEDAFDPRTFLFREEELLYLRLQKAGLDNVYAPALDILHLEDVSTNATYKTNRRREEFKFRCQMDSLGILLDTMREQKRENAE